MEVKQDYKLMGPSAEAARDPKEIAAYSVAGVGAVFLVAGLVGAG